MNQVNSPDHFWNRSWTLTCQATSSHGWVDVCALVELVSRPRCLGGEGAGVTHQSESSLDTTLACGGATVFAATAWQLENHDSRCLFLYRFATVRYI